MNSRLASIAPAPSLSLFPAIYVYAYISDLWLLMATSVRVMLMLLVMVIMMLSCLAACAADGCLRRMMNAFRKMGAVCSALVQDKVEDVEPCSIKSASIGWLQA